MQKVAEIEHRKVYLKSLHSLFLPTRFKALIHTHFLSVKTPPNREGHYDELFHNNITIIYPIEGCFQKRRILSQITRNVGYIYVNCYKLSDFTPHHVFLRINVDACFVFC